MEMTFREFNNQFRESEWERNERLKKARLEKRKSCEHEYAFVYQGYDKEFYACKKCRDRYSLYYEDMQ